MGLKTRPIAMNRAGMQCADGVGQRRDRRPRAVAACGRAAVQTHGGQPRAATAAAWRWYKGNTHTHTLESDGDSTPEEVTRWYREHGYQFLVLSDHNVLTRHRRAVAAVRRAGALPARRPARK